MDGWMDGWIDRYRDCTTAWNLRHVQQTILVVAYLRFDFCGWYVFGHLGTYIELNVERWFSTLWLNQKGCHWCFGWGFLRPRNKIRHIIFQDFKAQEPHSVVISIPFFGEWRYLPNWLAPHTQDLEKYKGFEKLGGNRKARCGVWMSLVDQKQIPCWLSK